MAARYSIYNIIDTDTGEIVMKNITSYKAGKALNRSPNTINLSGRIGCVFAGHYKAIVIEDKYDNTERNNDIVARYKRGESLLSIAKRYGFVSKYSVQAIINRYDKESRKIALQTRVGFTRPNINPLDKIKIDGEKYTVIKTYPYVVLACKKDRHGVMREYTFSYFEISKGSIRKE